MLTHHKPPKVPEIFVDSDLMFVSEAKSQLCHFLAALHFADLEEYLVAAPKEEVSIYMLAGVLNGEVV